MSNTELERVKANRESFRGNPAKIAAAEKLLVSALDQQLKAADLGVTIFEHTMAAGGGGQIGGDAPWIAMTADVDKLRASTDDTVQRIIRGADQLATFQIPKDAAIDAPSNLSKTEAEVLVPNQAKALSATLIDFKPNPYRR